MGGCKHNQNWLEHAAASLIDVGIVVFLTIYRLLMAFAWVQGHKEPQQYPAIKPVSDLYSHGTAASDAQLCHFDGCLVCLGHQR